MAARLLPRGTAWLMPMVLGGLLAMGGRVMWSAAAETPAPKPTTLSQAEKDRIRKTLETLSANQEKMVAALEELEAELSIVKVRVTR